MEKHKCKLCFKSYANGRALGGHMRSHMMNLPIQSKPVEQQQQPSQLSKEAESASSSSSSSSSEDEHDHDHDHDHDQEKGLLIYGLRENPKKSFRLADPEFAFASAAPAVDASASSVVLQDRESETESSKNPTRRRSKRTRKLNIPQNHHHYQHLHHHHQEEEDHMKIKKMKCNKLGQVAESSSWVEPEPVSSVSDATTEEDVAFCLMMLSRDKWIKNNQIDDEREEEEDEEDEEIDERETMEKSVENSYESADEIKVCKVVRNNRGGKYKCETCNKVFKSYQALGGHRASHKKIRVTATTTTTTSTTFMEVENGGTSMVADRKIHECPVCYRVFSSGQALGGHKRSHVIGSATATTTTVITPVKNSAKFGEVLIDLNLPAPMEDDDQVELSAVSDGEFVNHHHHHHHH